MPNGASRWQQSIIETQIKDENTRRQKEFELQQKLIEQQIKMNDLKIEKFNKGETAIEIKADGIQPELELILWKILEKIQIRANDPGAEFLLGI